MQVFYPEDTAEHRPLFEVDNGSQVTAYEVPERSTVIRRAIEALPFVSLCAPRHFGLEAITALHDPGYVKYLESESEELERLPDPLNRPAVSYPSIFPFRAGQSTKSAKGRRGLFCFDTYTPIFASTFKAARHSADAALHAAEILAEGKDRVTYALCRPPGHHAEKDRCGGYCYLNNAAVAAQYLSKLGNVAVLDLDVHHGNGTQHIFYERPDVLTASIHGDPEYLYPYFSGYADESGSGRGMGANRNFLLPSGTDDRAYQEVLETALEYIDVHSPQFVIISLGVDTHETDPIGNMALTTPYYIQMAATIRQLSKPLLVVQEGGYGLDRLGLNVSNFLRGLNC